MGKLKVVEAKMLATIQDLGRFGYRQFGIPQSGAMDPSALNQANLVVGNPKNYPGIEISLQGISFEAIEKSVIAVSGATAILKINGNQEEMYQTYELKKGDELTISAPKKGVYTYLGIGGKLLGQYDFGSISTYMLAGFGGLRGKPIQTGDVLFTEGGSAFTPRSIKSDDVSGGPIRFVCGPESHMMQGALDKSQFKIGRDSNRIGVLLEGSPISASVKDITSSAVIPGTVQLLPNGLPLVLMNDCQTTGGYPRIGKVVNADLGRLAQKRPGESIIFRQVAIQAAETLSD